MKKILILALSIFFFAVGTGTSFAEYGVQTKTTSCAANNALPDSACTPGAILTTKTRSICASGYTKTVRKVPLSETKKVFAEYGIPYSLHAKYEVDHLVSLELGGSNDISNLWPESRTIVNGSLVKDKFENTLHAEVCSGKITIKAAQSEIVSDWLIYNNAISQSSTTKKITSIQQENIISPSPAPAQLTKNTESASQPPTPVIPILQPQPVENPAPVVHTASPTPVTQPAPEQVSNPSIQASDSRPAGATARCGDGSFSFSTSRSGTCSHHGGVAQWY